MPTARTTHTEPKRRAASVLCQSYTHVSDKSWIFLPLFPIPSLLPWLSYIWYLHLNWVEKLIWKLGSCFSILCPLNKTCPVLVSASVSLLVAQIWSEKETPWPRQGVLPQAPTPAWIQPTSFITIPSHWGVRFQHINLRWYKHLAQRASPMAQAVKNPPAMQETQETQLQIPGSGRSLEGGNGNAFQYSYLENPMDIRDWQATIHGVTKSLSWLSMHVNTHTHTHTHTHTFSFITATNQWGRWSEVGCFEGQWQ